jgi:hypothetical protein
LPAIGHEESVMEDFLRAVLDRAVVGGTHTRLDGIRQSGRLTLSGEEPPGDGRAVVAIRLPSRGVSHVVKPRAEKREPHFAVVHAAALGDLPAGSGELARPIVPVIDERAVTRCVAEQREHVIGRVADEVLVVLAHGYRCRATPMPAHHDDRTVRADWVAL